MKKCLKFVLSFIVLGFAMNLYVKANSDESVLMSISMANLESITDDEGSGGALNLIPCTKDLVESMVVATHYLKCNSSTTPGVVYPCPASATQGIAQDYAPYHCYR